MDEEDWTLNFVDRARDRFRELFHVNGFMPERLAALLERLREKDSAAAQRALDEQKQEGTR